MPGKKRTPVTDGKVHGVRDMQSRPRARTLGAPAEAIGTLETQEHQPKSGFKIANVLPKYLYREIARVHRLAQAAGLFMEDRDLLSCPRCGLLEDVGCCGLAHRLIASGWLKPEGSKRGRRYLRGEGIIERPRQLLARYEGARYLLSA